MMKYTLALFVLLAACSASTNDLIAEAKQCTAQGGSDCWTEVNARIEAIDNLKKIKNRPACIDRRGHTIPGCRVINPASLDEWLRRHR